jgi:hypothetical protein
MENKMRYTLTPITLGMTEEPYTADSLGDAADELFQLDGLAPDELVLTDENGKNCNHEVAYEWLSMNVDDWADDKSYILPFVIKFATQKDIDDIESDFWESVQMERDITSRGIYS